MATRHVGSEQRDMTTYGRSHAVRLADYDYAGNDHIHLTICAADAARLTDQPDIAAVICGSIEFCTKKLSYRLYGYTIMPDHLHVLLSPADSRIALENWLRDFKSFTTNVYMKSHHIVLWQRSGHDHVCRTAETAEKVLAYIVGNPVRAGLVERWQDWPWTKVFIEI